MKSLLSSLLLAALALASVPAGALEPFVATYQAFYKGKLAGNATMRVVNSESDRWQLDLDIHGNRGFAGLLNLNIGQSTVFTVEGDQFRPLSQSTVRHALFTDKKRTGAYDWSAGQATWSGDIEKKQRAPVPLQPGDLSALLMNLAVIRHAQAGKTLSYHVVDNGKARQYEYAVAPEPEIVAVEDMSYNALRVARTNGGSNETVFWVADGVPTPIRILQRKDGEDNVDLRLIEYQGVTQ